MNQKIALIELHYLPCVEYMKCLCQYDGVLIEIHEHFQKQTYRNRAYILGANKVIPLVVPVKHPLKVKLKDLEIDYSGKWEIEHWRSIESSYAKAPFFDFYKDPIRDIIISKPKRLMDLNLALIKVFFQFLNVGISIQFTASYDKMSGSDIDDFRSYFHPKKQIDSTTYYKQVFGKEFVSNLSVVDLIFCTGPDAALLLKNY